MIESVKVVAVDTSYAGSGGRLLKIKPNGKSSFETPTRPISVPEFKAKEFLGFRGVIEGHLGAEQIDMNADVFARFLKQNGTVKYVRRKITKFADISCCFENFPILDVPQITPDQKTALKLLLEMQLRIPTLNNVSVPLVQTGNEAQFEKIIRDWGKDAEQYGKGVVPQLSMKEDLDAFKKKLVTLSEMADSNEVQVVNLCYANPDSYPHQFVTLWENREAKLVFNCSGVPSGGKPVADGLYESRSIELQRYGIDMFTRKTRTPDPKYVFMLMHQAPPTSIDQIQDFVWPYHPGGAILEKDLWLSLPPKNVECRCKVCKGLTPNDIRDAYSYDVDGKIIGPGMEKASKLHDVISGQVEYSEVRKRISSNEMSDYVEHLSRYREDKLTR